jgi:putative ABC transport system ATP-binding protein
LILPNSNGISQLNEILPPLICAENLSISYHLGHGIVHALRQIDLKIYSGQSVAIMGPSGSGKSTLLHLLGCLENPSAGRYLLNNQDVSFLTDVELALVRASKIGFVFQSFNLIPQLNVYENIEVPFFYHPVLLPEKEMRQCILDALERVKMEHRLYHLPSQLSGGEAQRVAIARALAIQPLLILADEPTGNLDSETGNAILQLFQELNEQGTTLIIVTHDEQVAACCQLVLHMRDGTLYKP